MKIDAQIEMLSNEIQLLFKKIDEMRKASAGFATTAETFTGKQDIKSLGFGDALKRLAASNSLTQELANKIGELVVLTDKRMALIEKGVPETSS